MGLRVSPRSRSKESELQRELEEQQSRMHDIKRKPGSWGSDAGGNLPWGRPRNGSWGSEAQKSFLANDSALSEVKRRSIGHDSPMPSPPSGRRGCSPTNDSIALSEDDAAAAVASMAPRHAITEITSGGACAAKMAN